MCGVGIRMTRATVSGPAAPPKRGEKIWLTNRRLVEQALTAKPKRGRCRATTLRAGHSSAKALAAKPKR